MSTNLQGFKSARTASTAICPFSKQAQRYTTCPTECVRGMQLIRLWGVSATLLIWAGSADAATLTLAWNPNPEPNITGYVIEYGNLPGVRPNVIDVGNQTSWQFNGLVGGMPYTLSCAHGTRPVF